MQNALQNILTPFPRLFPWAERLVEWLQGKDEYLRSLKWNRTIDAFMNSDATHQARLRIREELDTVFLDLGYVPADVWRSGEHFMDGPEAGEHLVGSRAFRDPVSGRPVNIFVRLRALYDGRLICDLATSPSNEEASHQYTQQVFATQAVAVPETTRLPWGVARAFSQALTRVVAHKNYHENVRAACLRLRQELPHLG